MAQFFWWLVLLAHLASAPADFSDRADYRLYLPYEYGFSADGACVRYDAYPSPEQILLSIQIVESGRISDTVVLFEDGSCRNEE